MVANARHNAPQEQSSFALDTELQYQCCQYINKHPHAHYPHPFVFIICHPKAAKKKKKTLPLTCNNLSSWSLAHYIMDRFIDLGYNTLGFARARCLQYNQTVKWFGPDVTCEGTVIHYCQDNLLHLGYSLVDDLLPHRRRRRFNNKTLVIDCAHSPPHQSIVVW